MNDEELSSHWFDLAPASLAQGLILSNLPVVELDEEGEATEAEVTGIVLTQTCDIEWKDPARLLVALVNPYPALLNSEEKSWRDSGHAKKLADGIVIPYFLLPPTPVTGDHWAVVSFLDTYHVSRVACRNSIDAGAVCLKSPYLEHFAQAYARFIMRVGLPQRIPRQEFEDYVKALKGTSP